VVHGLASRPVASSKILPGPRHTWARPADAVVMQMAMSSAPPPVLPEMLGDPAFRAALERFVRTRVPASEVDDIVQSALADALASASAPDEPEQARRWVFGIARHKVADFFRRNGREAPASLPLSDEVPAESAPHSARDLLRWAERELPEGDQSENTLEWMMREAAGDKLESIASEEKLPAPRVRQRVSRLRKHFRERWALQAAVCAVALLVVGGVWLYQRRSEPTDIAREIPTARPPLDDAARLRRVALEDCESGRWEPCLRGLDRARELDPEGDAAEPIRRARKAAADALRPTPQSVPSSAPAPSAAPPAPTVPLQPQKLDVDSDQKAPPPPPVKPTPKQTNTEVDLDSKAKAPLPRPKKKATPKASKAPKAVQDFKDSNEMFYK